ncbi:TPA: hypothetical protein ACGUWI_004347 [Vibrio vulnificus]
MTSNELTIYNKLLEVYPEFLKPISELSLNDSDKREFVLSEELGFDFDSVVNCNPLCNKIEKSPDALFCVNDTLYFIEFKEGSADKNDIRLKIHEAITTLFHFKVKYLPSLTKEQFVNLNIKYAVVVRPPKKLPKPSFFHVVEASSKQFSLKNIEGFLVNDTRVIFSANTIFKLLSKVTEGRVTTIKIKNYLGNEEFVLPAA